MRYGSVCSGIEAASVAWEPLGWKAAWFSEIDPFASAVLAERFPQVPNLGDFTQIGRTTDAEPVDLLVGGTPCQDFSVAGEREGMEGADGQLALEFIALLDRLRPRWVVWENVPGALSTSGGRDFGAFLGALGECGYGFAYRVLDAQYFGVPQRRRRVFVVGYLGDWRPPAAVLFERHSLQGHPPPRREAGQVASTVTATGTYDRGDGSENLIAASLLGHAPRANATDETFVPYLSPALRAEGHDASEDGNGRRALIAFTSKDSGSDIGFDLSPTLQHQHSSAAVAYGFSAGQSSHAGSLGFQHEQAPTLRAAASGTNQVPAIVIRNNQTGSQGTNVWIDKTGTLNCAGPDAVLAPHQVMVRRLTEIECERLQAFPDNWTLIPWRRRPAPGTPRYRAVGNSMATVVMAWLGERVQLIDDLLRALGAERRAA